MRRAAAWGLTLALALGAALALGPRNAKQALTESAPRPPLSTESSDLRALESRLAQSEAALGDVVPGTEKHIAWGTAGAVKAPWAVVYLHGFSATRQETAPLAEQVASGLGGHVFYTRLTGHGRPAEHLGRATVAEWKADALEALAIGQQLGEHVLVIGTSTGATLAAWLAQQPQADKVAGWIWVSPNFGPKDSRAEIVNWPWGQTLARWINGETVPSHPGNELEARYWTQNYPTSSIFPMMALVAQVRDSALADIRQPVLMLYSPRDTVINVKEAEAAFARLGSARKQVVAIDYSQSKGQHVLTGAITDPSSVDRMAAQILQFVRP